MKPHLPHRTVELDHLQLDNALALVRQQLELKLPDPDESAAAYMQALIDGLCQLSLKDPLTGLANRRHFQAVQNRTIDMVARSGEPALMLMLDIDHFKKINDTYGHQAGDAVLRVVAQTLSKCVRPMDTVARYGGEEFAAVLPECPPTYGSIVAERIRHAIESLRIPISPGVNIQITISIGGAFAPEWIRSTPELWSERADAQLYMAKNAGRNRVFLEQPQDIYVSAEEKSMLFGHLSNGEPAWLEHASSESPDTSGNQQRGV
jgi:two-component system, cell cycle response regulator